jgi:hypothetical protein
VIEQLRQLLDHASHSLVVAPRNEQPQHQGHADKACRGAKPAEHEIADQDHSRPCHQHQTETLGRVPKACAQESPVQIDPARPFNDWLYLACNQALHDPLAVGATQRRQKQPGRGAEQQRGDDGQPQ